MPPGWARLKVSFIMVYSKETAFKEKLESVILAHGFNSTSSGGGVA